jgi:hypothetical protein
MYDGVVIYLFMDVLHVLVPFGRETFNDAGADE